MNEHGELVHPSFPSEGSNVVPLPKSDPRQGVTLQKDFTGRLENLLSGKSKLEDTTDGKDPNFDMHNFLQK